MPHLFARSPSPGLRPTSPRRGEVKGSAARALGHPPSSPAERSEGKGIQGWQSSDLSERARKSDARPLLGPLPSAFGLAGGDGWCKRGAAWS